MPIHRLNHAVLYVSDVPKSVAFYTHVLGFRHLVANSLRTNAAFLQAPGSTNDHDLAVFGIGAGTLHADQGPMRAGLYHLGWELDTLAELEAMMHRLAEAGSLLGATDHGTTKSLYARDPDGIELEVAWIVPADLIDDTVLVARLTNRALDLRREIQIYGADTVGGVGVSRPRDPAVGGGGVRQ